MRQSQNSLGHFEPSPEGVARTFRRPGEGDLRHRPPRPAPPEKACGVCNETKAAAAFYGNPRMGLSSACRACTRVRVTARQSAVLRAVARGATLRWKLPT